MIWDPLAKFPIVAKDFPRARLSIGLMKAVSIGVAGFGSSGSILKI